MSSQQLVILSREQNSDGALASLGTRDQIVERLARLNTAPESNGGEILYGPGIRIELPPADSITQMLMTIVEEEIAWQVIMRLAKEMEWKLLDPATGRELTP